MPVDRNLWRRTVFEDSDGVFPGLPCPECGEVICLDAESIQVRMPTYNRHLINVVGDSEDAIYRFSAFLLCASAVCEEIIVASGSCSLEYDYDHAGQTITVRYFHLSSMVPAPPLIKIRENVSEKVADVLKVSFGLYWQDLGSCANKLRVAIECILDEHDIPRTTDNEKFILLDQRIENFARKYDNQEQAEFLKALKWIGNLGTHEGDIKRDRVLDAFELIEHVLDELYPPDIPDKSYLNEIRDEIILTKGLG